MCGLRYLAATTALVALLGVVLGLVIGNWVVGSGLVVQPVDRSAVKERRSDLAALTTTNFATKHLIG